MTPSPVYLVGGSRLFRQGLKVYLNGTPFEAVREIERAGEARSRTEGEVPPALILFALSHGQEDFDLDIDTLRHAFPGVPVVVIAESLSLEDMTRCLAAGVSGYLLSDISTDALSYSLQLVLLGEMVFPTQMATFWTQMPARRPASELSRDRRKAVQPRERDPALPGRRELEQGHRTAAGDHGIHGQGSHEEPAAQDQRSQPDSGRDLGHGSRLRRRGRAGGRPEFGRLRQDRSAIGRNHPIADN